MTGMKSCKCRKEGWKKSNNKRTSDPAGSLVSNKENAAKLVKIVVVVAGNLDNKRPESLGLQIKLR